MHGTIIYIFCRHGANPQISRARVQLYIINSRHLINEQIFSSFLIAIAVIKNQVWGKMLLNTKMFLHLRQKSEWINAIFSENIFKTFLLQFLRFAQIDSLGFLRQKVKWIKYDIKYWTLNFSNLYFTKVILFRKQFTVFFSRLYTFRHFLPGFPT